MTEFQSPLKRNDLAGLVELTKFVENQVTHRGLDAVSIMIIGQALYFKTKRVSAKPLTWPERRTLIIALLEWVAKNKLDPVRYEALQPSICVIVPDTLDSMREFGKSKGGSLWDCVCGKQRPTKDNMEQRAEWRLDNYDDPLSDDEPLSN